MKALSLFSGIGGLDLAAEAAGIRTAAMCEQDPFCRSVLRKHWPDVPIYEDIKKLEGRNIEARINVIHGGPPCQPVSVAGRRRGKEDPRYLWGEVYRIAGELMPDFLVFENVPGILSIAGDEICQALDGIGYHIGICQFEAAAVGAPHRRMRVFFVAYAKSRRPVSWAGERIRHEKENKERPEHTAPGSGESPGAVSYPGRGLLTGRSIRGTFREECGERTAAHAERPDSAPVANPSRNGRGSRRPQAEGLAWEYGASRAGGVIPDADGQRLQEQQSPIAEKREWTALGSTECSGRRLTQPGMGGVAPGTPPWMDGRVWWGREPDIPRAARGIKNRVARLKALGNCVVPAQAYPIFRAIAESEAMAVSDSEVLHMDKQDSQGETR